MNWFKLLKIGGASGAAWEWLGSWSCLGMADKGDSAEWPTRHDYPQKKEETLNLKT